MCVWCRERAGGGSYNDWVKYGTLRFKVYVTRGFAIPACDIRSLLVTVEGLVPAMLADTFLTA